MVCIITSRYLESDHCLEEAVLSKTLDMAERRKRIVPLIFERFSCRFGCTDGFEKLRTLLRPQ